MRARTLCRRWLASLPFLFALPVAAHAAASGDHPLVGRYEGANLVGHSHNDFDEVEIINGPILGSTRGVGAPGWTRVEGKIDLYYYALPAGRSSLEVLRTYEASLASKGFATLFTCATSNGSCYEAKPGRTPGTAPYDFGNALDEAPELPRLEGDFIRNYFGTNARYLLAKLARAEGAVYASIALAEGTHGNYAFVRVIETKEMERGKITFVGAQQMQEALVGAGRISLYGIHFDFDRDTVMPDSKPTLDEIARLLQSDPSLRLSVVGHTDGKGGADYNFDLSRRRAANVVAALNRDYGVDATRLVARGAGANEPLAPNDSEENRARNRRVELVKR